MCELYRVFARDWEHMYSFTDSDIIELFNSESYGTSVSASNGFALGKKWLNVQVTMWREDIKLGLLFKEELYQDPKYPVWWLNSIFKTS